MILKRNKKQNKNMKRNLSITVSLLLTTLALQAQNPVIWDRYTSDPAAYVHGDTLYLFTDHDEDETENGYFTMKDWQLYCTVDMVNWTYLGTPMTSATFSAWAKQGNDCWASQCIERNGKWYWYVTATVKGQTYPGIGVAVADSPAGPYHDPIGKPLAKGWYQIDPTVFVDDDGLAWLFWGNNNLWYAPLSDDMVSFKEEPTVVDLLDENAFGPYKGYDEKGNPKTNFEEAPWVYKRGGKYFMEYAAGGVPEHWAYSTSDNIRGPWTYRGRVMDEAHNSFTIHGGSVEYKGHHYMVYHNGNLPGGGGFKRSVCFEEYTPNADGTIPFIPFTSEGVAPLQTLDPYVRQQAVTINQCSGVRCVAGDDGHRYVTGISRSDYIKVRNVDFGSIGPKTFSVSVASTLGGNIDVRLDSKNGLSVCMIDVPSTKCEWQDVTAVMDEEVTGIHDVYFCFSGRSGVQLFDFADWQFHRQEDTAIATNHADRRCANGVLYSLSGLPSGAKAKGIYIKNKEKLLVR